MSSSKLLHKVLWVDDDTMLPGAYKPIARHDYDLELVHFTNWIEAEKELKSNFDNYEAIILDARCYIGIDKSKTPNAITFLSFVLGSLRSLMTERGRWIPWYILSAGASENIKGIEEVVWPHDRFWDRELKKCYYQKGTEEHKILFQRIREYCDSNPTQVMQIKALKFPDVFAAIRRTFNSVDDSVIIHIEDDKTEELTPDKMESYMVDLLMPFVDDKMTAQDCNKNFILARKVLNYIYEHMYKKGDFPKELHYSLGANLNWCSLTLKGEVDDIEKQPGLLKHLPKLQRCRAWGAIPKILTQCTKTIFSTSNQFAHIDERAFLDDGDNRRCLLDEMFAETGITPYLIKSFALQLCDILMWYASFREKADRKT